MFLDKLLFGALTALFVRGESGGSMLVEAALKRISEIADAAARDTYTRALRSSVIWERIEDELPPTSASDIVAMTGIDASVLEANGILLSKQRLAEYAVELGAARTIAMIRKGLTETTYARMFDDGRVAVRSGKKLLLSYAEARFFLGIRNKGRMPAAR